LGVYHQLFHLGKEVLGELEAPEAALNITFLIEGDDDNG
jgi:hypothetical protein